MSKSTISTFQLFEMFPDQETARVYLEGRLWPNGAALPGLRPRRAHHGAQGRLLPLQPVQGGLHGPHRHDFRAVARSAAQVDLRDVPARDGAQGHFVHATRQGNRHHAKVGVVRAAAAPRGVRRSNLDKLRGIVEIDETYVGGKEREQARSTRSSTPGAARSARLPFSGCASAAAARWPCRSTETDAATRSAPRSTARRSRIDASTPTNTAVIADLGNWFRPRDRQPQRRRIRPRRRDHEQHRKRVGGAQARPAWRLSSRQPEAPAPLR